MRNIKAIFSAMLLSVIFLTGCTSYVKYSKKDPAFTEVVRGVNINVKTARSLPIHIKRQGSPVSQGDKGHAKDGVGKILTLFNKSTRSMLTDVLAKEGVQVLGDEAPSVYELRVVPNSGDAMCVGFSCSTSLSVFIGLFTEERRKAWWSSIVTLSMPYEMMDDPEVIQDFAQKVTKLMKKEGLFQK